MKRYVVKGHWSRSYIANSYLKAREMADKDLTIVPAYLKMAVSSISEESINKEEE
jgi:hypothetical protein